MFILTTLWVSDLEKSLTFYRDLLGLPLLNQFQAGPNRIAMLGEAEGTHLELIEGKTIPDPSLSVSIGFAPKDLSAVLAACAGEAEGPISPNPNTTFWFVGDPDGYRIQLVDRG